ncbi:MAG TPA: hypothetical protein VD972_21500, partial [Hyalangium sp.]|nr:hypothetical protein [Hyalangium sp.]
DVWATGIVLYEMLCGRLPVEGPEYVVMPKLSQGEFPRPRDINPRVPQELEDIIMGALTVRREDRYESSHVFGEALAGFLYSHAPRFSTLTLSHYIQDLFSEALVRAGREVQVPGSFQEELASWRADPRAAPSAPPEPRPEPPAPSPAAPSPAASSPTVPALVNPPPEGPVAAPPASSALRAWKWSVGGGTALGWLAVGLIAIAVKRMPRSEPVTDVPTEEVVAEAPEEPAHRSPPSAAPSVDVERYIQQAKAAVASRRYEAAMENYRVALKFHPSSLEAKAGLGFSLAVGRTDEASNAEAVKLLQEVVEKDSLNSLAWFALGMALQVTREEEEAAEAYKTYLVLEPSGRFAPDARIALKQLGAN